MNNFFDLLDEDETPNHQIKKISTSKRAQKKALKNSNKPMEIMPNAEANVVAWAKIVYNLEELWMIVLEYLGVKELFLKIGMLNQCELKRVNNNEFIVKLLKLYCNGHFFDHVDGETKYNVIHGIDHEIFFKSITDPLKNPSFIKRKVQPIPRHLENQTHCKPLFKNIYKQLMNINKENEIQEENRMHHARFFIERELVKLKKSRGASLQKKQLECSHFRIERSDIDGDDKFKHLFMCKKCGLGLKTNFLPEGVYSKMKLTVTEDYDVCGRFKLYDYQDAGYRISPTKHNMEFVGL